MTTLTATEVEEALKRAPGWTLDAGKLQRGWVFPSFAAAMVFVNGIARIAEQSNHHPDIHIRYNKVRLALISHDAGGLTKRDARMAEQLSREFPEE